MAVQLHHLQLKCRQAHDITDPSPETLYTFEIQAVWHWQQGRRWRRSQAINMCFTKLLRIATLHSLQHQTVWCSCEWNKDTERWRTRDEVADVGEIYRLCSNPGEVIAVCSNITFISDSSVRMERSLWPYIIIMIIIIILSPRLPRTCSWKRLFHIQFAC